MENEWDGVAVELNEHDESGSFVVKGESVEEATLTLDD